MDDTVWRHDDGQRLTLRVTDAAMAALGIEGGDGAPSEEPATDQLATTTEAEPPTEAPAATPPAAPRKQRDNTKQALLIAMLKRPEGASIAEIVEATGWQAHTVRGAIAGALKKKLGLNVTSEKVDGRRAYRIEQSTGASASASQQVQSDAHCGRWRQQRPPH